VSQAKQLENDFKYLERFILDIEKHRGNLQIINNVDPQTCDIVFKNVKEYCQKEILNILEANKDFAQYIEIFSNRILNIINGVKQNQEHQNQKVAYQIEAFDNILGMSESSLKELSLKIEELKSTNESQSDSNLLLPTPHITDVPPVKERPSLRKVGSHPGKIKRNLDE
jgi:hypothetical protein